MLRYFETCEEIYLQLAAEGWRDWAEAVHTRLDGASAGPAEVAHALTQTLPERPLFCDLLAHTPANLEHNVFSTPVPRPQAQRPKTVCELAALVTNALPPLGERGGVDLIVVTTMLAGSIWQSATPPAALVALYKQDPELADTRLDFMPTLRRLIGKFIDGCATQDPRF